MPGRELACRHDTEVGTESCAEAHSLPPRSVCGVLSAYTPLISLVFSLSPSPLESWLPRPAGSSDVLPFFTTLIPSLHTQLCVQPSLGKRPLLPARQTVLLGQLSPLVHCVSLTVFRRTPSPPVTCNLPLGAGKMCLRPLSCLCRGKHSLVASHRSTELAKASQPEHGDFK